MSLKMRELIFGTFRRKIFFPQSEGKDFQGAPRRLVGMVPLQADSEPRDEQIFLAGKNIVSP